MHRQAHVTYALRLEMAGGSSTDCMARRFSEFVSLLDVKQSQNKARLVASLADVEQRLSVGTSEKLQLAGLVGIFTQMRPLLVA